MSQIEHRARLAAKRQEPADGNISNFQPVSDVATISQPAPQAESPVTEAEQAVERVERFLAPENENPNLPAPKASAHQVALQLAAATPEDYEAGLDRLAAEEPAFYTDVVRELTAMSEAAAAQ